MTDEAQRHGVASVRGGCVCSRGTHGDCAAELPDQTELCVLPSDHPNCDSPEEFDGFWCLMRGTVRDAREAEVQCEGEHSIIDVTVCAAKLPSCTESRTLALRDFFRARFASDPDSSPGASAPLSSSPESAKKAPPNESRPMAWWTQS